MQKVREWEREFKGKWKYIILITDVNSSSHAIVISIQLQDPTPMIAKSLICASSAWNLQFQKEHNMNCLYDRWVQSSYVTPNSSQSKHRWYCWCSNQMLIKPLWPTSKCFCFCTLRDRRDLDSRTESFYQSWSSLTLARISFLTLSYVNAICEVKWK
jgi:hypothetical protein